jgi:hypothetical protein
MIAKHTGDTPWRTFKGSDDEPERWTVVSDYGYLIATIENGAPGDSLDTEEANASLIAAAPDLLEAVIYQLDLNQWIESADAESPLFDETLSLRLNTANDYMKAAIAKATGEAML